MRICLLFTVAIMFNSCVDEVDPILNLEPLIFSTDYSQIIEILTLKNDVNDTLYRKEYFLDNIGRVYEYRYFNYTNPQYNFTSKYTYSESNRLTQQVRNEKIFKKYRWSQNAVSIIVASTGHSDKVTFINNKVHDLQTHKQVYRKFEWENDNLISVSNRDNLVNEYFMFQETPNPYYFLKSIELDFLQDIWTPISRDIHLYRQDQPIDGDDFSVPLRTYEFQYTTNNENLVTSVHNDLSLIYTSHFIYLK